MNMWQAMMGPSQIFADVLFVKLEFLGLLIYGGIISVVISLKLKLYCFSTQERCTPETALAHPFFQKDK